MADDIGARLRDISPGPSELLDALGNEAADEIERLRDVLYEWDALIEHQYTGSREAMSDMTYAAQATAALLYGKEPWPQKTRVEKQAEEIERLRAALVYISVASEPHRHAPTYTVEHLHGVIGAIKTRARTALAGEKANG